MNSHHKLYNHIVHPPDGMWTRIAEELDELREVKPVADKLSALSIVPPADVWQRITGELNDEASFNIIAQKLTAIAVAPPADVWHKIESSLYEPKVVPIKKNPFFKYAIAACMAALLGFGGYLLFKSSSQQADKLMQSFAEPVSKQPTPAITLPPSATEKKSAVTMPLQDSSSKAAGVEAPLKTISGNAYATTLEKNKEAKGRYIVLMTEDGNVVRMSKKLGDMADCIAGASPNTECNNQIAQWQKELATAPVSSTPDNFLDILEMVVKESEL